MKGALLIASPEVGKPSHTFLDEHIRNLSPGNTVIACTSNFYGESPAPILTGFPHTPARSKGAMRLVNAAVLRANGRIPSRFSDLRLHNYDRQILIEFLRTHRVGVILAERLDYAPYLLEGAQACGLPLYVHSHGLDVNVLGASPAWRRQYRTVFSNVEKIIVASRFLALEVEKLGAPYTRIEICPLGVPIPPLSARQEIPDRILCVCRLIPQKGVDKLVAAYEIVRHIIPGAQLDIIGWGQEEVRLRRLAREAGGTITFHGPRPHEFVLNMMRRSKVYAQHCVTLENGGVESFGLSIVEAMACAVPVVSSCHGAIMETIVDGETGFLIEEFDVQDMADKIVRLLSDECLAREMGEKGRARAETHYSMDRARNQLRRTLELER